MRVRGHGLVLRDHVVILAGRVHATDCVHLSLRYRPVGWNGGDEGRDEPGVAVVVVVQAGAIRVREDRLLRLDNPCTTLFKIYSMLGESSYNKYQDCNNSVVD